MGKRKLLVYHRSSGISLSCRCTGGRQEISYGSSFRQIEALDKFQDESGMWHTLVDDPTSYVEASATCGFGYGILKAVRLGFIDEKYKEVVLNALEPILKLISEDGTVNQVSYGTPMGRESKDLYKEIEIRPMPYGQALAMLFLLEVLKCTE